MSVSITLDGNVKQVLKKLVQKSENLQPLFAGIGDTLIASTKERLDTTKRSPEGKSWEQLSPEYAAFKNRVKPNVGLLRFNDDLMSSIIRNVSPSELKIGTNMEYARRMQFGGGGVKARPFLGISTDDNKEIKKLVITYYEER
ncbi:MULTISPECIES: phage virion morphogenesis protein [Pasteurellaceae]|uniref:Phage virion morphogenesis protein n=1 Tax=Pasteurella atlantica TaxID=2827233 RepID=A0AAW8CSC1_9PAST|nr:phage virion morphogenesis protein [Pasteurella atlantica]MBR0573687.1 phage virion morphogenesis protein [Pasteurella atlantica]MDP8039680.1 phage virion morphogenesis protein [Pasteurella atlantica]MDP8041771.1 phage virion morphogenesis protein [Pasteurella atlantica]MDP8043955.1 phage virion morphogenesis protein [Pasteurella atlantica]MDP8045933.1 phage virion morphogenesis protein [Pasteurella atlantica]